MASTGIQLRPAQSGDAAAIAHVHVATWRTAYQGLVPQSLLDSLDEAERTENWKTWLARTDVDVLVAEEAGTVQGFIAGGPLRDAVGSCDCEIYAIYVLADAQRRGVGCALMKALASAMAGRGFRSPAVWVLADNPARHFYVGLGARQVAEKQIEIGGKLLTEVAYGWLDLQQLQHPDTR